MSGSPPPSSSQLPSSPQGCYSRPRRSRKPPDWFGDSVRRDVSEVPDLVLSENEGESDDEDLDRGGETRGLVDEAAPVADISPLLGEEAEGGDDNFMRLFLSDSIDEEVPLPTVQQHVRHPPLPPAGAGQVRGPAAAAGRRPPVPASHFFQQEDRVVEPNLTEENNNKSPASSHYSPSAGRHDPDSSFCLCSGCEQQQQSSPTSDHSHMDINSNLATAPSTSNDPPAPLNSVHQNTNPQSTPPHSYPQEPLSPTLSLTPPPPAAATPPIASP